MEAPSGDDAALRERLLEMSRGYVLSRAIHVAADLRLANHVHDAPVAADVLARLTRSHAPHLERLLRLLASYGIFAEVESQGFVATPLSRLLADGSPQSMRAGLGMVNSAWWAAVGDLGRSVRTGECSFVLRHQQHFFSYLKENPADQQSFDAGMAENSRGSERAIARAYEFPPSSLVVDVGGGRGGLLRAILERHPGVRGRLFEQPQVVERVQAEGQRSLEPRFSCEAGDFFDAVPAGGDIYLLKGVLHDFEDERCIRILENCRVALGPASKLLLIERLITRDNQPHQAKTIDLLMMTLLGGRERTASEWAGLLGAAGLKLCRQLGTEAEFTIAEAVPL